MYPQSTDLFDELTLKHFMQNVKTVIHCVCDSFVVLYMSCIEVAIF